MSHRIVFFGSGNFGVPSLAALASDARFDVCGILTQPAKPGARGKLQPTPVHIWAEAAGRPSLTPSTLKTEEAQNLLRSFNADAFVVIAYGLILPAAVLRIPPQGCLNVHGSLLPKYRGASPIPASLLAGDTQTGITIMQMDAGIDTGPILHTARLQLTATDTALTVSERLSAVAAQSLPDILDKYLRGEMTPQPQSASPTPYAKKITKEDGQANWTSGLLLERQVRAFLPWPNVWTTWNSTRMKILAATFEAGLPSEPPGTVVTRSDGWAITCQDGWLIPTQVQFAGKKPQPAKTIPGSYPAFIGSHLG